MKHEYKVCQNKGNARFWIEGNRLSDNGFHNGMRFDAIVSDDSIVLDFSGDKRKIAGTVARPIIDMTGKWVTAWVGEAKTYIADFDGGKITITRGAI